MNHECLLYDGKLLHWRNPQDGQKEASYKATSGFEGYQTTDKQCVVDKGPVPAGRYLVFIKRAGQAKQRAKGCGLVPAFGLQMVPYGSTDCHPTFQNWGNNRVRFLAADHATKSACPEPRDGFYLHDSTKGFSHGCIEVANAFFNRLYMYTLVAKVDYIELRVEYAHRDTNGGTKL